MKNLPSFQTLSSLPEKLLSSSILICQLPIEYLREGSHILKLPNKDDSKETILLLFGGAYGRISVMNYTTGYNEWNPLINSNKEPTCITKKHPYYRGLRTVIGGSNNNLLFIIYYKAIDVFDLNIYEYVANASLPIIDLVNCKYLESKPEKPFAAEILPPIKNKKSKMLLFYENTGLSIEYDEDNKLFQFDNLRVCSTIRSLSLYGHVHINGIILFFGGKDEFNRMNSNIHKYIIDEDKWIKCEQLYLNSLYGCTAILNEDHEYVHIVGGGKTHFKTKTKDWIKNEETAIEKLWLIEEEKIMEIEEMKQDMSVMQPSVDIKKLKVALFIRMYCYHFLKKKKKMLVKYFRLLKQGYVHPTPMNNIKFSPDGTKILASADKQIQILGKRNYSLCGHSDIVNNAKFSSDGKMIVSCSNDHTIRLWDVKSRKEIKRFEGHTDHVTCACFSPNGSIIASGSKDCTIRLWDVKSGKEITQLMRSEWIVDMQFSPNGQFLKFFSHDFNIQIWNLQIGGKINDCVDTTLCAQITILSRWKNYYFLF
ncbi:hypothetical protein RFI_28551 [Reticulomyxa filosa]|uniref:Uncharacterized protein n=1 Tax=Reticulomyxa filosa TaxID=46433 RepID=X6M5D6_RETFI|nr:hypothetical protein RFI_28551 [Reticulomyxa filosa]|eukprot:ETO08836.1 hypothetical protein RFI_28551 [Reticulomyxa filosa]